MSNTNFTTHFSVPQRPAEVYRAITNVRGWWSENIVGETVHLNDEFIYHYKTVHLCKLRVVTAIPGKKIEWLVLENEFSFTANKHEWKDNRIIFTLSENPDGTEVEFTQQGLHEGCECYGVCRDAWTSYLLGSLRNLITTGSGQPNTKENDLNQELIEKWDLPAK